MIQFYGTFTTAKVQTGRVIITYILDLLPAYTEIIHNLQVIITLVIYYLGNIHQEKLKRVGTHYADPLEKATLHQFTLN